MSNPKTVTLISPYPGSLPELPEQFFSHSVIPCSPDQVDELTASQAILLHLNGNLADGPVLIQQLKRKAPRTPVLILGENPSPRDIIEAYDSGADGYFLLPLDLPAVRQKLRQYLQRNGSLAALWRSLCAWLGNQSNSSAPQEVVSPVEEWTSDLEVRFFGSFDIWMDGNRPLVIRSKRVRHLLACLIYYRQSGISSERLMDLLWPEVPCESARNSLNVALSQLRQVLGKELALDDPIPLDQGKYSLAPELSLHSDLDQFKQYRIQGERLDRLGKTAQAAEYFRKALAFYQGDFLEEFLYQEWTTSIRDTLWENRLYLLERLGKYYFDNQDYHKAIEIGRNLLDQDPCLEKVHRQLMLCYWKKGDRSRALQQFAKCEAILREELNAVPSASTREIYDEIRSC